ncbi:hypothetical protein [Sulfurisphaera ohwakuensis]|uniref:hypothetical protein n=1 Tax=Sulfurisphaera ohwakuensis TaxID=69656 RepID=UPI0036F2BB95
MLSFTDLQDLIKLLSLHHRRKIELYYFIYKIASKESTLDEFNQYFHEELLRNPYRKIHVLK